MASMCQYPKDLSKIKTAGLQPDQLSLFVRRRDVGPPGFTLFFLRGSIGEQRRHVP